MKAIDSNINVYTKFHQPNLPARDWLVGICICILLKIEHELASVYTKHIRKCIAQVQYKGCCDLLLSSEPCARALLSGSEALMPLRFLLFKKKSNCAINIILK